jgi:hypothetical protein
MKEETKIQQASQNQEYHTHPTKEDYDEVK